jgi:hypothetical protein
VTSKSHKFHIECKKEAVAAGKTSSIFGRNHHAWTFRARSHDAMIEWWNDLRMLVARYLVASEQIERSGPVAAAVRAAGYTTEDEEEMTDEEEGSSIEEEAMTTRDETIPPGYSSINKHTTLEIGPNGYPIEKKIPGAFGDDAPEPDAGPGQDNGGGVGRRPSKRQQEKAPEGKPPHMYPDAETAPDSGPAPRSQSPVQGGSRFVEGA